MHHASTSSAHFGGCVVLTPLQEREERKGSGNGMCLFFSTFAFLWPLGGGSGGGGVKDYDVTVTRNVVVPSPG